MGVVSGIVMSYQFGTNWSVFSDKAGPVIGPLMAYEVLTAFFLEAGFLGVMLFGMNRVGAGLHFFATLMVAVGTCITRFLDPERQQLDADAHGLRHQAERPVPARGRLADDHLQSELSLSARPHGDLPPILPPPSWWERSAPGTCCATAPTSMPGPCSRWRCGWPRW